MLGRKRTFRHPLLILGDNGGPRLILITLQAGSRPLHMVIDTGASMGVMHNGALKGTQHELEDLPEMMAPLGFGGAVEVHQLARFHSIKIGAGEEFSLPPTCFLIADLSAVNETLASEGFSPIDGILGADVLVGLGCSINLKKGELSFRA